MLQALQKLRGAARGVAVVETAVSDDCLRAQAVLSLVRSGRAYVKLSAPYRIQSALVPDPIAVAGIAARYLQTNPERVLCGSDWPHTSREPGKAAHEVSAYKPIELATLGQDVQAWLPTTALRAQMLADNPARLYDF